MAKMSNEYMREYLLKRYHNRRSQAIAFLGGKCVKCGSIECLELDHKDPKTKSFEIAKLWSYSKKRFWEEVKKCQLLCKECHEEKTILERGYKIARGTHGTLSSYRYCRCEECKRANSEYGRKIYLKTHPAAKAKGEISEIEHGTRAAYLKEKRRKINPCNLCLLANTEYTRQLRINKRIKYEEYNLKS